MHHARKSFVCFAPGRLRKSGKLPECIRQKQTCCASDSCFCLIRHLPAFSDPDPAAPDDKRCFCMACVRHQQEVYIAADETKNSDIARIPGFLAHCQHLRKRVWAPKGRVRESRCEKAGIWENGNAACSEFFSFAVSDKQRVVRNLAWSVHGSRWNSSMTKKTYKFWTFCERPWCGGWFTYCEKCIKTGMQNCKKHTMSWMKKWKSLKWSNICAGKSNNFEAKNEKIQYIRWAKYSRKDLTGRSCMRYRDLSYWIFTQILRRTFLKNVHLISNMYKKKPVKL